MVTRITTEAQVRDLVDLLSHGGQKRPICIVTISSDPDAPQFNAELIEEDCSAIADVYAVRSGELTRIFQELVPDNCHVFGGAARCYGVDFHSAKASGVSTLYYPVPAKNLVRETQRLIGELWGMAKSAGLIERPKAGAKTVTATVEAIYGAEVAILKLASGDRVSLRSELAFAGVPLDKVLKKGQEVSGYYNSTEKTFSLEQQSYTEQDLVTSFGLGTVTLGLVKATDRQWARVAVHPNLVIEVKKDEITGNPLDVISRYYRVGEVYPFRLYRDPQGRIRLKSNDIDDDEVIAPALALVPGGEPWLESGRGVLGGDGAEVTELLEELAFEQLDLSELGIEPDAATSPITVQVPTPLKPQPGGIFHEVARTPIQAIPASPGHNLDPFTVNYYVGKIKKLTKDFEKVDEQQRLAVTKFNDLARERDSLKAQVTELRQKVSDAKDETRAVRNQKVVDPWDSLDNFDEMDEWLNYELLKSWVETYEPGDRRDYPLNPTKWVYGETFFDNFTKAEFTPTLMRKAIRTLVELLSGRPAKNGTERHPLTGSHGGNQIVRPSDNAKAMRMYVEESAASARRLHYWELTNGRIELAQIAVHDDYQIK